MQPNDVVATSIRELLFTSIALIIIWTSILVSWGLIAVVAYYAFSTQWLPAIFFLLARKELIRGLDAAAHRFAARAESLPEEQSGPATHI